MFHKVTDEILPWGSIWHPTSRRRLTSNNFIRFLSDFLDRNTTEENVVRGDEITCATKNNTFSCINQWYIGNNSCPLSCDETITTHLVGEYLCTVKCDVRGTEYNFKALKAVVVEATTSPPPSQSGKVYVTKWNLTFEILDSLSLLSAIFNANTYMYEGKIMHKQRAPRN